MVGRLAWSVQVKTLQLTDESQDDCEQGRCRERDGRVELQHLEQLDDEDEDLVLRVPQQHRDGNRLQKSDQLELKGKVLFNK